LAFVEVRNPLNGLPRQLTRVVGDVGRIADGMQALPGVVKILAAIEKRTESLESEVRRMRADVVRMSEKADVLESLPEKLDEVSGSLHPLRRTMNRFGRANGETPERQ
jgi:hypothetical protein